MLVYPFLGVFLLKVQKGCVYVIMLKIALVLVKNIFFGLKKGISELLHWIAQKHTANRLTGCYVLHAVIERYFPIHLFNTILIT